MPQSRAHSRVVRPRENEEDRETKIATAGGYEIHPRDPAIGFYRQASEIMKSFGFDPHDEDIARRIIEWGREQYLLNRQGISEQHRNRFAMMNPDPEHAVVYYMRVGDRVKIGWTTNIRKRLATLVPEELLATERGGFSVEKDRHRQFDTLHTVGEWFRYEGALVDHINRLVQISAQ